MKKKKKIEEEPLFQDENMSTERMLSLLTQFYQSEMWPAYKMYVGYCVSMAENMLFSLDPVKEPTLLARKQGMREAFMMLESYIVEAMEKKKREKEENKNNNGEIIDTPNGY